MAYRDEEADSVGGLLNCPASSRKVAGSIPDCVIGIFH